MIDRIAPWALCFFCNGNGCRQCGNTGETHTNDETAYKLP